MKNTKKVLSVALAGALAFGAVGTAFAAAPVMGDSTDVKVKEAVERLYAFGIVNGMDDGQYHEEMKVTREQFAKILVEAMGLGDAASAANGATQFADVQSDRWSSGYINVAVGQGVLKGYPDGTFRPDAEVSYAEAVTMLVRSLGYKDEFLSGAWPGNYVAKAADVGITEGAKFDDPSGTADRGTVALLVDNTLDSNVVKVKEYTDGEVKYSETDTTLLKDKLNISKYEDVRVLADKTVDDGLDKDEVKVNFLKDISSDNTNVENHYSAGTKELEAAETSNTRSVMGQESTIYVDDNDQIIYAESENDDKANYDFVEKSDSTDVSLVKFDKDMKFADDAVVYVFNESDKKYDEIKGEKVNTEDLVGKYGQFVVKNNEIVYARVDSSTEVAPWMSVTSNESGLIKGIEGTDDEASINLGEDTSYDGVVVFDANGNEMKVEDIKEGNIITVQQEKYDGDDYAVVTVLSNTSVTGKLEKVKSDAITIDGKEYDVQKTGDSDFTTYYKLDNDKPKLWGGSDWKSDMEDADDADITAVLDPSGRVVYVTSDVNVTSSDMYGVVTRKYSDSDKVKIYTKDADGNGDEITYDVEKTADLDKMEVGDAVKFNLNKKGEIADGEVTVATDKYTAKGDFGKNSIKTEEGTTFSINDDAVILNADGLDDAMIADGRIDSDENDDFDFLNWKDISEDNSNGASFYVFSDNGTEADAVVFVGNTNFSSSDDSEGVYVIDTWSKGEDDYAQYVNQAGEVKEAMIDSDSSVTAKDEEAYVAKINSSGEIELMLTSDSSDQDLKVEHKTVKERTGNTITFEDDTNTYNLPSNAVVYDEDNKKSTSNIKSGMSVGVVIEDGVNVRVVELNDDCDVTPVEIGITGTPAQVTAGQPDVAAVAEVQGVYTFAPGTEDLTIDGQTFTHAATTEADKWSNESELATLITDASIGYTATVDGTNIKLTQEVGTDVAPVVANSAAITVDTVTAGVAEQAAVTGVQEVNTLTVSGTATKDGQITVTLNDGTSQDVTVDVTKDETAEQVATKIAAQSFTGYTVTATGNVVTFTADTAAADKDVNITLK